MTRTLFLLNALALAVLVGLILQPEGSAATPQTQAALALAPHLATFNTPAGAMPASIQPPRLQPRSERRLIF